MAELTRRLHLNIDTESAEIKDIFREIPDPVDIEISRVKPMLFSPRPRDDDDLDTGKRPLWKSGQGNKRTHCLDISEHMPTHEVRLASQQSSVHVNEHDEEVKKITNEYSQRALKESNLGADIATYSAANSQLGSQDVTRLAEYD